MYIYIPYVGSHRKLDTYMVKSIEATAAARAYITRQLHSCSAPSSHFDEPFIFATLRRI